MLDNHLLRQFRRSGF